MKLLNPYFNLYQALAHSSNTFEQLPAEIRKNLIWAYSWSIPTTEAILKLTEHSPLLEAGAGTGYWAWLCEQAGGQITAFDRNATAAPHWTAVHAGDASWIVRHPDKTLFLCWPPLDDRFAADCLTAYAGQWLFYVGEFRGRTADTAFHEHLEREFTLDSTVQLPCWPGFSDRLHLFRRK
ncbi:MAG: hypothetical protein H7222_12500 [Methylotenera sp.]|nr:hypothetical protein [Oligoflexia bacterium]